MAGQNQVTCFQGTLETSEKDRKIVTLPCASIIQVLTMLFEQWPTSFIFLSVSH